MKAEIGYAQNLNGEVFIHGSKNAALPIIASTILLKRKITLYNVPDIKDIDDLHSILKELSVSIIRKDQSYIYEYNNDIFCNLNIDKIKKIRASYYLWGVLLNNKKTLMSYYPGGCNFQDRPLDIHYKIIKLFGYNIVENKDYIIFKKQKKIKKYINIHLEKSSFGATINAILLSIKGNKKVKIYNYAKEPEVMDFINFLNIAGAKIKCKNNYILITGVRCFKEINYTIMQDRIEAGSYIFLSAAYPNSMIKMKYYPYKYIKNIVEVFIKLGGKFSIKNDYMFFISPSKVNDINLTCDVYPSFPTDLQQIICSTLLETTSVIKDLVYLYRISQINELKKINANLKFNNQEIVINPSQLSNNVLSGIDLRGTFGLIIASGKIKEKTLIRNIDNLLRGYSELELNLKNIKFPIEIN